MNRRIFKPNSSAKAPALCCCKAAPLETQETLALLKILALGKQDVVAGKMMPVAEVTARLRAKQVLG